MIIDANNLKSYPAYDLLQAAAHGRIGIDRRWLHALIDEPAKTLPDIVKYAAEDREEHPIPLDQDLIAIFTHLKSVEGLPFLLDVIRYAPDDIPDEVVEALVVIGAPAVDPLLKLYEEIGNENGGEIAFLLAGLGIHDQRILDLLVSRLATDWGDALFHLEVYHDPAAIPLLEAMLEVEEDSEGEDHEERLEDLQDTIEDLREERPVTHAVAFDIWEPYPEAAPPEFELLQEEDRLEYLASADPELRAEAASSFFGEEFSPKVREKLLNTAKNDPVAEVRACSWEAFFDNTDGEDVLQTGFMMTLVDRLLDEKIDKTERAGIAVALARHTDRPEVHAAILKLADDPETRERAVEAMWRSFDSSFGPFAVQYLDDLNVEVRRNAIWAVGYLQVTKEAGRLPKFFDDDELRSDAIHNYAMVAPGVTTRKKIHDLYEKIADMAKGVSEGEADILAAGLDVRLVRAGLKPVYQVDEDGEEQSALQAEVEGASDSAVPKVGRNDLCPCGSGKKYKKCHGG